MKPERCKHLFLASTHFNQQDENAIALARTCRSRQSHCRHPCYVGKIVCQTFVLSPIPIHQLIAGLLFYMGPSTRMSPSKGHCSMIDLPCFMSYTVVPSLCLPENRDRSSSDLHSRVGLHAHALVEVPSAAHHSIWILILRGILVLRSAATAAWCDLFVSPVPRDPTPPLQRNSSEIACKATRMQRPYTSRIDS